MPTIGAQVALRAHLLDILDELDVRNLIDRFATGTAAEHAVETFKPRERRPVWYRVTLQAGADLVPFERLTFLSAGCLANWADAELDKIEGAN